MERSPTIGEYLLSLWRMSRPEAWMVTVLPVYVGYVLASKEIFPGFALWASFWAEAGNVGAGTDLFLVTLREWLNSSADFLLAMLVMGPLIWTATLLINDVHDLPGDRVNPRKARSPLVQDIVSAGWASGMAHAFAVLSLAAAWFVNTQFFALVAANLVLAWLYSVPPVRLKTRPGADVMVNAIGVGFLSALAGWSIHSDVLTFPFEFAFQGLLVAIAVYVPTTLVDHDFDKQLGYLTLATHLGPKRAYRIGWYAWVAANIGAVFLSYNGLIIPTQMFPILVIFTPLLIGQYHFFIGGAKSGPEMVKGIILCSFTFLAVNMVFVLLYTGLWVT